MGASHVLVWMGVCFSMDVGGESCTRRRRKQPARSLHIVPLPSGIFFLSTPIVFSCAGIWTPNKQIIKEIFVLQALCTSSDGRYPSKSFFQPTLSTAIVFSCFGHQINGQTNNLRNINFALSIHLSVAPSKGVLN